MAADSHLPAPGYRTPSARVVMTSDSVLSAPTFRGTFIPSPATPTPTATPTATPTPYPHIAGNGLHGSNYDTQAQVTWNADWSTATAQAAFVPLARTVTATSPLTGGGALSSNISIAIQNAAADGSTKGASAYTAADFDAALGIISIDYTNGQAASTSTKGFLTSTDWNTFNNKQAALTTGNLTASSPLSFDNTRTVIGGAAAVSIANAAADGSTKGAASFTAADFDASSGNISIDYTNGQAASASNKGFLTSADWSTFNGKQAALTNYVATISVTSPITGSASGAGSTPTIAINNAAADGATKGAASFTAADFDAASGIISLDYTNGQKATTSLPGFLSAADWTTFNAKQAALTGTAGDELFFTAANTPGNVRDSANDDTSITVYVDFESTANWYNKMDGVAGAATGSPTSSVVVDTATFPHTSTDNAGGFSGTAQYLTWATGYHNNLSNFSVACWFKTNSATNQFIVSDFNTSTFNGWAIEYLTASSKFNIALGSALQINTVIGTTGWKDNNWHLGVWTFNRAGNCIQYIDGIQDGTLDISARSADSLTGAASTWRIAQRSDATDNGWNGSLDEFKMWKGVILTPAQIRALYLQRTHFLPQSVTPNIKLPTTFSAALTAGSTLGVTGTASMNGNVNLGDTSGDSIAVAGVASFSGGMSLSNYFRWNRTTTATNYAVVTTDNIVGVTSTASARTITLYAANAVGGGGCITIKDESGAAATNNITIARAGSDTIDGATSKVINTNYGVVRLYSDGSSKFFTW